MPADDKKEGKDPADAHHLGKHGSPIIAEIFDQALENEEIPTRRIKHPWILDVLLTVGLLVAAGGFTVYLLQLYVTHTAEQCLIKHNYKATIALLGSPPIPAQFSSTFGNSPKEILNEALYMDAMSKIETQGDVSGAVKELQKITPNSNFFENAQRIITEKTIPSNMLLQGGTSIVAPTVPLSSAEKVDYILQAAEQRAQSP